jgi:hypothetical protein
MAQASLRADGTYEAKPPVMVGKPGTLISRLLTNQPPGEAVFLGFDYPIGLPLTYAQRCGIEDFLELLPLLGEDEWRDFYLPAEEPDEIRLTRPFYPQRPGHARQSHLLSALGVHSMDELRRVCELPHAGRRAAAPLFWTLGGQQVGKAAISGWRDVLGPALKQAASQIAIWPFSGLLSELFPSRRVIIAETYPGEFYKHLGAEFPVPKERLSTEFSSSGTGKRSQAARAANTSALMDWAVCNHVALDSHLQAAITNGFGPSADAEDPFDATIGLFGMLNVLIGQRPPGELPTVEPFTKKLRTIEGWILGQEVPASFPRWLDRT